jgi:beta-N-acetylhexosaminidase
MDLDLLKSKPFYLDDEAVSWVHKTKKNLTLKEKIGQIFIPFCDDHGKENLKRLLHYKAGGIHSLLREGCETLRSTADYLQKRSSIPLLMTADMEFNPLNSLPEGTHLPSQLGIAATGDFAMARKMGMIAGREARYCGLNWSFTPSVDISRNFRNPIAGDLSFGNNPDTVAAMGTEYIKGLQSQGMAACAKHWPGDGIDDRDQHLVTTRNSMNMTEWRESFGRVYQAVIDAGVKTVMSAHITLPAYYRDKYPDITADKIFPGSISRELNLELLRRELGFNGLIISDATTMAGLTSQGLREHIIPLVIENGCDMFLFSVDDDMDLALLMKGAESGFLSAKRLEDAVIRVLALKASLGLHKKQEDGVFMPANSEFKLFVRSKNHITWEKEITEKSITLVKDTQNLLPLNADVDRRILIIHDMKWFPDDSRPPLIIPSILEDSGFEVTEYQHDTYVDPDIYDVVLYLVAGQPGYRNGSYRVNWDEIQRGFLKGMNRYWHLIPTLFISMGNPYHLYEIPRCKTYINAYSPVEPVQKALVDGILGKKNFFGMNPVDPFCGLEEAHL